MNGLSEQQGARRPTNGARLTARISCAVCQTKFEIGPAPGFGLAAAVNAARAAQGMGESTASYVTYGGRCPSCGAEQGMQKRVRKRGTLVAATKWLRSLLGGFM